VIASRYHAASIPGRDGQVLGPDPRAPREDGRLEKSPGTQPVVRRLRRLSDLPPRDRAGKQGLHWNPDGVGDGEWAGEEIETGD
jgi:hypothetical protein